MPEEIRAEIKTEGEKAFPVDTKENENSSESPTVDQKQTTTDQSPSSEEDKNTDGQKKDDGVNQDDERLFNHPRWQQREDDWKKRFNDQEQRHTQAIEDLRKSIEGTKGGAGDNPDAQDIPAWFGGTQEEWEGFLKWNQDLVNKSTEPLRNAVTQSEEQQKKVDAATKYFEESVSTIETDKSLNPQGVKVDRNKLIKFVIDNDIVDSQGRWNWKVGHQLMQSSTTQKTNSNLEEKKKLADGTVDNKKTETTPPAFRTSEDFANPANRPW